MGAHADLHDCGRDRLWHFLGRMEERLTLGTFLPLLGSYCSRLRHRSTGEREPLIKNSSSTPLLGQGLAPSGSARPPETAAVLQVSCGEVYLLLLRYSLLPIIVRGRCETVHRPSDILFGNLSLALADQIDDALMGFQITSPS